MNILQIRERSWIREQLVSIKESQEDALTPEGEAHKAKYGEGTLHARHWTKQPRVVLEFSNGKTTHISNMTEDAFYLLIGAESIIRVS